MREKVSRRKHKLAINIDLLHNLPLFVSHTLLADSTKTIAPSSVDPSWPLSASHVRRLHRLELPVEMYRDLAEVSITLARQPETCFCA